MLTSIHASCNPLSHHFQSSALRLCLATEISAFLSSAMEAPLQARGLQAESPALSLATSVLREGTKAFKRLSNSSTAPCRANALSLRSRCGSWWLRRCKYEVNMRLIGRRRLKLPTSLARRSTVAICAYAKHKLSRWTIDLSTSRCPTHGALLSSTKEYP